MKPRLRPGEVARVPNYPAFSCGRRVCEDRCPQSIAVLLRIEVFLLPDVEQYDIAVTQILDCPLDFIVSAVLDGRQERLTAR